MLRFTDPSFAKYVAAEWIPIRRTWAIHAQAGLVHLGNTTNNRLENANGRVKKVTHHGDRLINAIQKVSKHSEWLMKEFEVQAAEQCDKRPMMHTDSVVQSVIGRLTNYASGQVLRHLGRRKPHLLISQPHGTKASETNITDEFSLVFEPKKPNMSSIPQKGGATAHFMNQCCFRASTFLRFSGAICQVILLFSVYNF